MLQILESDDKYNDDLIFFPEVLMEKPKVNSKQIFVFMIFSKLTVLNSYNMISIGA